MGHRVGAAVRAVLEDRCGGPAPQHHDEWVRVVADPGEPSSSPSAKRVLTADTATRSSFIEVRLTQHLSTHLSGLLDRFERRNGYLSQRECSNGRLGL